MWASPTPPTLEPPGTFKVGASQVAGPGLWKDAFSLGKDKTRGKAGFCGDANENFQFASQKHVPV